jgi:hypothetical protein
MVLRLGHYGKRNPLRMKTTENEFSPSVTGYVLVDHVGRSPAYFYERNSTEK